MNQARIAALALAALLGACPGAQTRPTGATPLSEDAYPWTLRPPTELPFDFMWRQSITARFGDRSERFDAVLQKQGDALTLLGLGPGNIKAFVLRQRGETVAFESFMDRGLAFPPRFVLIDVQRAYFPVGVAPVGDGEVVTVRDGEEVTERFAGGQLRERRFRRFDGQPDGLIRITYEGWEGGAPRRVHLDNGWFGYRLEIETVEARVLSPAPPAPNAPVAPANPTDDVPPAP